MKNLSLSLLALLIGAVTFAQAPEKFNYQAVVRDNSGLSVTNQLVGVRVSILEGSVLGAEVFAETHGPTTNGYGLINLQIGTGSNLGPALSTIDWSANQYYIKIEIDPTGGTSYSVSSTSQLLSVPYALHAGTVDNTDDADADPTNELIMGAVINGTDLEITDAGGTTVVDVSSIANDADSDPSNEIQTLSKVGQIVTLSNGGGAFTDDVNDADASATNELNTGFNLVGTTLQIQDAGGILNADLSSLANDADSDPFNEIQTISKSGSTVTLSNGGGSFTDEVDDADPDNTNELQTISKSGSTVTLSDGGGTFTDDVDDADNNPSNELQTINKTGNTVTLSNSGGTFTVDDADASASNELNTGLSLSGNILTVTDAGGGQSVDLSPIAGGGADPSSTNELITSANLSGTDLIITEAGTPWSVDLSSLVGGGDPSSSNEFNTGISLSGNILTVTDGGGNQSVDLSPIAGGGGGSSYRVGQLLGGGVIVFVDSSGQHGLIAGLEDLNGGAAALFESPNATGPIHNTTAVSMHDGGTAGTGNHDALLGAGANFQAANLCEAYAVGGTGWFLPSAYELQIMSNSGKVLGDDALTLNQMYWSSTQVAGTTGFSAYVVHANYGYIESKTQSTANVYVRPMKAF